MFKSKVPKKSRLQTKESTKTDAKNVSETVEKLPAEAECMKMPVISTPVSRRSVNREDCDDELLSPFTMRFTQDSADDDLDVIWDWDSPQSKNNRYLQRRRILHASPNVPQKRIPFAKGLPMFGSLKAELEELTSKLNAPVSENCDSNESCLVIEDDGICLKPDTVTSPVNSKDNSDLFDDDSFDAEMIKCSQQVEKAFFENSSRNKTPNCNKNMKHKVQTSDNFIKDDSFDVFLEEVKEEHINLLSQGSSTSGTSTLSQPSVVNVPTNSPRSIARTNSMPDFHLTRKSVQSTSSSVFPRTKSEDLYTKYSNALKIRCSPEEIEKKRQEARAKLEWKRKQNEIEKRRLEAVERLKRNRLQRLLKTQNSSSLR
ncbi:hypothetical protein CBL_03872 [Carabus blaptoides fortunei]